MKECEEKEEEYISKIDLIKKEIVKQQYQHNDGMNQLEAFQIKEN